MTLEIIRYLVVSVLFNFSEEHSETHNNGTTMNPPESTAYKPETGESTVSPYAEMRLPQSHVCILA